MECHFTQLIHLRSFLACNVFNRLFLGPGFKKVCSYKSEYANPWFRAGKKHWLKNIKSRIQLSKTNKPQQGSHSSCVDPMKDNLEEEVEKLGNDNISLKIELQKLKDRQENMRVLFPTMKGCRKDTEISNILVESEKILAAMTQERGHKW